MTHLEDASTPLSGCDFFEKSQRSYFNTNYNPAKSLNYNTFFIAEKQGKYPLALSESTSNKITSLHDLRSEGYVLPVKYFKDTEYVFRGAQTYWVSQVVLVIKNLPVSAGDLRDMGSILGWGRSPGGGHGNPFQYSCPKNLMNREAWQAMVHRVAGSDTTGDLVHAHTHARAHMQT